MGTSLTHNQMLYIKNASNETVRLFVDIIYHKSKLHCISFSTHTILPTTSWIYHLPGSTPMTFEIPGTYITTTSYDIHNLHNYIAILFPQPALFQYCHFGERISFHCNKVCGS